MPNTEPITVATGNKQTAIFLKIVVCVCVCVPACAPVCILVEVPLQVLLPGVAANMGKGEGSSLQLSLYTQD